MTLGVENSGKGRLGTDKAMTSSDVAAAVSVPKPLDAQRLSGSVPVRSEDNR